jgi:hypothetical protein
MSREIRWAEAIASALCVVGAVMVGLYFHSYEPDPTTPADRDAARARAVVNCGYSMYDVEPQAMQCARFDAIALVQQPCLPECPDYTMTLHADGKAELVVAAPQSERGHFEGHVGSDDFRRLANLVGTLALDRRGHLVPSTPGAGSTIVRAGCRGAWRVDANLGGEENEVPGVAQCLVEIKQGIDWNRK